MVTINDWLFAGRDELVYRVDHLAMGPRGYPGVLYQKSTEKQMPPHTQAVISA